MPRFEGALTLRDLGVGAIMGVPGVMSQVPDGAVIELDPAEGRVRIIDAESLRNATGST